MKVWPLVLACACATPRPIEPPVITPSAPIADARATLTSQFRDAVAARRFDEVLQLLSKRWRDQYDARRLERDFDVEPLAQLRTGRPLKLVEEDGALKVDSLE